MEQTANLRVHGTTRQVPRIHFEEERSLLRPLPPAPYDASVIKITRANSCCRVQFDSNRYSVPFRHAGRRVEIKVAADRLVFYGASAPAELIATHPRCYGRHRDIEDPEHVAALLGQRRKAREQRLLVEFLALGPQAESSTNIWSSGGSIPAATRSRSWPCAGSTAPRRWPAHWPTRASCTPSPRTTSPTSWSSAAASRAGTSPAPCT